MADMQKDCFPLSPCGVKTAKNSKKRIQRVFFLRNLCERALEFPSAAHHHRRGERASETTSVSTPAEQTQKSL